MKYSLIILSFLLLSFGTQHRYAVTVNILDYGGKGDGITDNYNAFQTAENYVSFQGGGSILVPKGIFIVNQPFYHQSFVTLIGEGDSSIIRNIQPPGPGDEQFCIHVGNFSPSTFGSCTHFDLLDVDSSNKRVFLKNKADISNFTIGQIVLIDSDSGFISTDGQLKPYVALINKVIGLNATKGVVRLQDSIKVDIVGANIAPAKTANSKQYICQYANIKNLRFESLGDWTLRFGCYKTIFQNLSIKSTDAIGGNGLSYCTFKNIRAEFSQKVIEMAMYSHNTIVDSFTAVWWNGVQDPANKPIIKMGENVRECSYSNMTIDSRGGTNFNACLSYGHAFNNKIFNSHFICPNVPGSCVEHSTPDHYSIVVGNKTFGNTFEMGAGDYYILFDNGTSESRMYRNEVYNNNFSGGVKRLNVKYVGSTADNVSQPNSYSTSPNFSNQ